MTSMFMRVNSKCAHQLRAPSSRLWLSLNDLSFDRLMEHVYTIAWPNKRRAKSPGTLDLMLLQTLESWALHGYSIAVD